MLSFLVASTFSFFLCLVSHLSLTDMVQKSKEKLGKTAIGLKETRTSKVRVFQGGRKAAPQKRKVSGVDSVSTEDKTKPCGSSHTISHHYSIHIF